MTPDDTRFGNVPLNKGGSELFVINLWIIYGSDPTVVSMLPPVSGKGVP